MFLVFLLLSNLAANAAPTPQLDVPAMEQLATVIAKGSVNRVCLLKTWVDQGYQYGLFECHLEVEQWSKAKGVAKSKTLVYHVNAYMEGLWQSHPPRGFIYQNTNNALSPGTVLWVYLKPNEQGALVRVHFNSGFEVVTPSNQPFPVRVGQCLEASTRPSQ